MLKADAEPEAKEQEEERAPWWKDRAAGLPLWAWAGVTLAVVVSAGAGGASD